MQDDSGGTDGIMERVMYQVASPVRGPFISELPSFLNEISLSAPFLVALQTCLPTISDL